MTTFTINGKPARFDGDPEMPLLWFLRDEAGLTGTKFGCGIALCGACTVHVDGNPTRSCQMQMGEMEGLSVSTIEAMNADPVGRLVQAAWIEKQVPQCGYCQSGQIMSATALLKENAHPTDDEIDIALSGNVCRCGTYLRIRAAIHAAAGELA
jgi:aerobic-type carbon monoxide dehydrogenase small subunit (CoxS/CutS family)